MIAETESITTSSLVPGKTPELQLVATFQSPLPPTQAIIAAGMEIVEANNKQPEVSNDLAIFFTKRGRFRV
jgi:hypothetical protein